jgi:hypothetical protein
VFGQNVTEHNPAPSPSGHPLLSGLNDIHQIFTGASCWRVMVLMRGNLSDAKGPEKTMCIKGK